MTIEQIIAGQAVSYAINNCKAPSLKRKLSLKGDNISKLMVMGTVQDRMIKTDVFSSYFRTLIADFKCASV